MAAPVRLDYERLASAYWENLTSQLRSFNPAGEHAFLKAWVHEEDDADSILNILECARDFGLERLCVTLGEKTLARLDRERLQEYARELGTLSIAEKDGGLEIEVLFPGAAGGNREPAIHPLYRARLKEVLRARKHDKRLEPEGTLTLVEASEDGGALSALIDASHHHIVVEAAYSGAKDLAQQGLLEWLCGWMAGRPIQDCADHGAIALEFALRDPAQTHHVKGIVQPENADPAFHLPNALIRSLRAQYHALADAGDTANFFDPPCSADWRAKSAEQRLVRIREALGGHPDGRRLEALRVEGSKRVVVRFLEELPSTEKQVCLVRIEDALKKSLEPELQVYLEPLKDMNAMRKGKL